jgi:hypothetical protein
MEGKGKGSYARRLMEGEGEVFFHFFPLFPQTTLLRPLSFSFDIKVLLYHGSKSLFTHFLPFPWPINCDRAF